MPKPTMTDVHVSAPLTNISTAYIQDEDSFVARKMFPVIPVQKQADKYYVWNKGDMLRLEADERSPGAKVKAGGMALTTAEYSARRYAARWDIPDPLRDNQDSAVQLERAATEWISNQMLMKSELVWATKYFATGLWSTDYDGGASATTNVFKYWSSSGSTPLADVDALKAAVKDLTGKIPNKMCVGYSVFQTLRNHADVLDRIKYTQKGVVTTDLLAELFGVDEFIVGKAIRNTANEGATDSLSAILGKHALLAYVPKSPGLMTPSPGYTFAWTGYTGAGAAGNRIKKYRLEENESDVIEGELAVDHKLVAADLGAFMENIVQ
jgi:hypothetical protein